MEKSIRYVRRNGEVANRHSRYKMFSVRHIGVTIRLRLMTSRYKMMSHNTKDVHISFLTLRTKENQKRRKHNI